MRRLILQRALTWSRLHYQARCIALVLAWRLWPAFRRHISHLTIIYRVAFPSFLLNLGALRARAQGGHPTHIERGLLPSYCTILVRILRLLPQLLLLNFVNMFHELHLI